jgi:DNA-binding NarL/FixJ family response regulator
VLGEALILRVAHFRSPADAAPELAARAQAIFARVRRSEGLAWSAVGRQDDEAGARIISVSLWRDPTSMQQALSASPDGRSAIELREGLPAAESVELADVVDAVGLPAALAPIDGGLGRRRRGLLPQDRQLLRLLCGGATLAEAAATLGVSVGTAKNRRHEVYEKLGVHDLTAACAVAAAELDQDPEARAS